MKPQLPTHELHVPQGEAGDHLALRGRIVSFMRQHPDDFAPFIEEDEAFEQYCKRMAKVYINRAEAPCTSSPVSFGCSADACLIVSNLLPTQKGCIAGGMLCTPGCKPHSDPRYSKLVNCTGHFDLRQQLVQALRSKSCTSSSTPANHAEIDNPRQSQILTTDGFFGFRVSLAGGCERRAATA